MGAVSSRRRFGKNTSRLLKVAAVAISLYYLYTAAMGELNLYAHLGVLLGAVLVFAFLRYPFLNRPDSRIAFALDCLLALLSVASVAFMMYLEASEEVWRAPFTPFAKIFNDPVRWLLVVLIIEASRRAYGLVIPVLAVIVILYARFGSYVPGLLQTAPTSWSYVNFILSSQDGIFGPPLGICARVIILFLIFSALLEKSGATSIFTSLAESLVGRFRGGPAKAAVLASAGVGTMTGSAIANVVAVGTFTIPLMKSTGYTSVEAGAIETLASTGSQIMPPVMGATAFIMAQLLGISYFAVCVGAAGPAILYYVSLFIMIDLVALKRGLKGRPTSELPKLRKALAKGWFVLIPIVVLIYLLGVQGWTAQKSALYTIGATIVASLVTKESRLGLRRVIDGLAAGFESTIMITLICACAGVLIGALQVTGLGNSISAVLVQLAHGSLPVLLILVAITSLILGLGLPIVACYLFLVFMMVPAFKDLGQDPFATNMFLMYFGVLSEITPPYAPAAFAAAPIARESPNKIAMKATYWGVIVFIVPFFFMYNPALLLRGPLAGVAIGFVVALVGISLVAFGIQGIMWGIGNLHAFSRPAVFLAGVLLMAPSWYVRLAALGIALVVVLLEIMLARRGIRLRNMKGV